MADPAVNRRGILATLLAGVFWTCTDAFGKLATDAYPTGEIMAIRGMFAVALAVAVVVATGHARVLWRGARLFVSPVVSIRALFDAAVVLTFYKALPHMQLGNITAISQTTPIIMTLMAAALGMERIGWRRFLAISAGFSGVMLIVKPSADGLTLYAVLAVVSAALVAARDLLTRYIDPAIPSPIIALMTAVAGGLAGLALSATEEWQPLVVTPTLYLVLAGLLVTLGNLSIVIAFRNTDVGVIAPFRYFGILMALLLGYMIFGDLPDVISIAGIVLIMASGIYTMHRERVRRRLAAASAAARVEDPLAIRPRGARAAWTMR
jgi:drug/metabolite transporter (DMT)-like permease